MCFALLVRLRARVSFRSSTWADRWCGVCPSLIPRLASSRTGAAVGAGGVIRGPLLTSLSYASFAVFATRADEYQACWTGSATSIDGEYFLRGLPDGAYKVGLSRNASLAAGCPVPPSDSRWYGDTAAWDSAAVITIRDHEVIEGIELHWR